MFCRRQEGLVQLSEIKVEPLSKDQALGRKISVARRYVASIDVLFRTGMAYHNVLPSRALQMQLLRITIQGK